ncbi:Smr/MutS family protein, partial [Amycolatopsis sp. NPDC051061]|uniref:Smr/MutS family protein n=1 Tax=Amycolatopsis sp. NPDC051061 TaxID=3155042 RepID=UPI00342FB86B
GRRRPPAGRRLPTPGGGPGHRGRRRPEHEENAMPENVTVDLHPIFRSDRDIDRAVRAALFQAAGTKAARVEIITGKGAGQLRTRVLAMLRQPHLKKLYRRAEVAPGNDGVVLVHLR